MVVDPGAEAWREERSSEGEEEDGEGAIVGAIAALVAPPAPRSVLLLLLPTHAFAHADTCVCLRGVLCGGSRGEAADELRRSADNEEELLAPGDDERWTPPLLPVVVAAEELTLISLPPPSTRHLCGLHAAGRLILANRDGGGSEAVGLVAAGAAAAAAEGEGTEEEGDADGGGITFR